MKLYSFIFYSFTVFWGGDSEEAFFSVFFHLALSFYTSSVFLSLSLSIYSPHLSLPLFVCVHVFINARNKNTKLASNEEGQRTSTDERPPQQELRNWTTGPPPQNTKPDTEENITTNANNIPAHNNKQSHRIIIHNLWGQQAQTCSKEPDNKHPKPLPTQIEDG